MADIAFIGLGSNLGDREAYLDFARESLRALDGVEVLATSSIDETAPFGPVHQGPFLNQMVAVRTELDPPSLLRELHAIEQAAGRTRTIRWGPRTLDLDIVAYARQRYAADDLTVPHIGLADREFWQRELAELLAELDVDATSEGLSLR